MGSNVVQIADDLFNSGNIQVAGIPRLPMLIQSYEDFAKADAVLKPYIDKAFGQKGSTVLASYTYPLQFIWGRKKLKSLDDIKGMKLRVAQPEQGEFVRRFGGTSITMSAPEVPSALDRSVVDGIFTAGVGAVLWKDLLKYGYVLIINVNNSYFIANTEAYNKLSPDLQAKLRDVAQQSARWDQDTMQKEEAESVQILSGHGVHIHQGQAGRNRARDRHHETVLGGVGKVARTGRHRGAGQDPYRSRAIIRFPHKASKGEHLPRRHFSPPYPRPARPRESSSEISKQNEISQSAFCQVWRVAWRRWSSC